MSNELVAVDNALSASDPDFGSSGRRPLAEILKRAGQRRVYSEYLGKNISYDEHLALQVWEALVEGKITFADGTHLDVGTPREFLELAKFLHNHLDGPVTPATAVGNVNLFKVYIGINQDEI